VSEQQQRSKTVSAAAAEAALAAVHLGKGLMTRLRQLSNLSATQTKRHLWLLRSPGATGSGDATRLVAVQAQSRDDDVKRNGYDLRAVMAAGALGAAAGIMVSREDARWRQFVLPSQHFRTCCEAAPLSEEQKQLPNKLETVVGKRHVSRNVTLKGSMIGKGTALAVVNPGTLTEAVNVLRECAAADVAIIPQGANTGLTGGSVPRDEDCDRPAVVINMRRLTKIMPIGQNAHQVLCFAGAGIFDLQQRLKNEFNRDSHSVLGSIFLNPSVAAGVAFGSGGTQIRKGPVFTERALFCRVTKDGNVELVDTLGMKGGSGESSLSLLEDKTSLSAEDLDPAASSRPASWPKYTEHITKYDNAVSRYNADTTGIDCNRSEGKVMILATIHDTHPLPSTSKLIWVACKDFATCNALKREVALSSPQCMAKSCEYIERSQFDVIDLAGRVLIKMIEVVGMSNLGSAWNLKLFIESLPIPFAGIICDKILYWLNPLLPESLPKPLMDLGRAYDHHMLVEFAEYSDGEVEKLDALLQKFVASQPAGSVGYHYCTTPQEVSRATLWRFAVQPAFKTYCVGKGLQGLIVDYAMPKDFPEYQKLPEEHPIHKRCLAAHFGCNVYHESLMFGPEVDVHKAKKDIKRAIEASGGKLPAEHGHGTDYAASHDAQARWMRMDPTNTMNPGVGGTSAHRHYGARQATHHGACQLVTA